MTQYAYFDHSQPAPQRVLGWYDTAAFVYPNLPDSADLLELSPEQWAGRVPGPWAVSASTLVAWTPAPPAITLAQQAAALLAAGLAVTSTGSPTLNATYPCDLTTQQQVQAEVIAILLNSAFTDGETTLAWLDKAGVPHTFTIDQFKALATAIAAFVTACARCISGQSESLPPASAEIA